VIVFGQVDDHAARIAQFAIAAAEVASETVIDMEDVLSGFIQIRVGLHSGPVTACVLGQQSPK
jgi:class 3 adenylate cyclase